MTQVRIGVIWPGPNAQVAHLPILLRMSRSFAVTHVSDLSTDVLGGAEALYGSSFSAMLGLKALTSFEDGDLPALSDAVKARLREAVLAVDRVPIVGTRSATVLPDEAR